MNRTRTICIAVLLAAPSCAWAGTSLPGAFVPLPLILREPIDFVAVCVAEDEPAPTGIQGNPGSVQQRFRLLGLVVGRTGGRSAGNISYRLSGDGFERPVRKGERVLWLGRCQGKSWQGVHVFADTPENRDLVYSRVVLQLLRAPALRGLDIEVETDGSVFAPGQPIPVRVQIDNTSDSTVALWSNFSALQFEALAEDGDPVACPPVHVPRFDRTKPLIVKQYGGPIEAADLADRCDWLPDGGQRSYTLLWRGRLRVGSRKAAPLEMVSAPIRLTVIDLAMLAWGADGQGVTCGLAAGKQTVSMGDRMVFYFGLKSDSLRVDPDLHTYRYSPPDGDVHFTFRNTQTQTLYERVVDIPHVGPPYSPKDVDFFALRNHPILLWELPVRLLHQSGEQVPPGAYEVTATYEPKHDEQPSSPRIRGPLKLYRGRLVSAPVMVRIQHADPESVEIYTNSAIDLHNQDGFCSWTGRQDNPTILRVIQRPGFSFTVLAVTAVAVGGAEFKHVSGGGYGARWTGHRLVTSTWEEGFQRTLGPDACRAMATGESLQVRVDVTISETADLYGHRSPTRGDTRIVWQTRLEARRP